MNELNILPNGILAKLLQRNATVTIYASLLIYFIAIVIGYILLK